MSIPFLPENAPFSVAQRQWLNGYLAGLLSDANASGAAAPAAPQDSAPKPRLPVLFGSQSGNSEELAETFAERLTATGFDAPVVDMADVAELDLSREETLCCVTSTWGDGDPPDNAADFFSLLEGDDKPDLSHLSFSVLALGDSNYLEFCGAGKKLDAALEACGGNRIHDRADCDVDYEETAETWFAGFLSKVGSKTGSAAAPQAAPPAQTGYSKKNPFPAPLTENRMLNAPGSGRDTRHFTFDLEGSGLSYEVGDVLGVYPQNCPGAVSDLLAALGFDGEEPVPAPDGTPTSLRVALEKHYAITQPNKKFLDAYAARLDDAGFTDLCADSAKLGDYLWGREIVDIVGSRPLAGLGAEEFVSMLGKIAPRLYSISSSPKAHPGQVQLTVAAVRYEAHGKERKGVCSTFLADRVNGGGARVFVQAAKHFKPPVDPALPMVMVGPGTGIAPFRAFLEERQATAAPGKNWLFFGNPHEETDFLYREELTSMVEGGTLHRLDTAWSRDQEEKVYVQDKMRTAGAELWAWLEEGAHFYVCGDAKRMAKDVDTALHDVVAEHGGMSPDDAAAFVEKLKKEGRYARDIY